MPCLLGALRMLPIRHIFVVIQQHGTPDSGASDLTHFDAISLYLKAFSPIYHTESHSGTRIALLSLKSVTYREDFNICESSYDWTQ